MINAAIILRVTDKKSNDLVKFFQEMLQTKQVRDDHMSCWNYELYFLVRNLPEELDL